MFSIFLLLIYATKLEAYGYDSGSDQGACGKPYRSSRMHQPPCDLENQTYCTSAGKMYPWHAVRRFIRENQGLMKRMYGDERHIAVIKAELQTNDIPDQVTTPDEDLFKNGDYKTRYAKDLDFDNELYEEKEENTARYMQERTEDIILNTKFVYEPGLHMKLSDLQAPRFRPTTTQKPIEAESSTIKNINNTFEVVYDNLTEIFYEADENQTLADVGDSTTVDEEIEVETTTEFVQEATTASGDKKEPSGEVLFQDMDTNKPQSSGSQMNLKLKGINACPVKEEVVAPFWANNTRGEVLALLNMYPFEQYVHWEKCTFENRQMYCREGCRCEQQYRLHRLLAYDPNNECRGIFSDWFKFPSCCVCKCYDMPAEFRVTSRSPRSKEEKPVPNWFKKKMSKQKNRED